MQIEISEVNKILKLLYNTKTYNFKNSLPKNFNIIAEEKDENWGREYSGIVGEYTYILQYNQYYIKVTVFQIVMEKQKNLK